MMFSIVYNQKLHRQLEPAMMKADNIGPVRSVSITKLLEKAKLTQIRRSIRRTGPDVDHPAMFALGEDSFDPQQSTLYSNQRW